MIFYHSNWHGSCFLSVYCKFVLSNKSLIPDRSSCFLEIFSEQLSFLRKTQMNYFMSEVVILIWFLPWRRRRILKSLKWGELFPYQEVNCMESSLLTYSMFYINQGGTQSGRTRYLKGWCFLQQKLLVHISSRYIMWGWICHSVEYPVAWQQ